MWIEARDELSAFINGRRVCCNDIGPDANYRSHRTGRCRIGKENLSKWLVNQGWALDAKSSSAGRYQIYERAALLDQRGMWKGCFVAPVDFRRWNRNSAKFLGPRCPSGAGNIRDQLFPADPDTPPGCSDAIKAKFAHFWSGWSGAPEALTIRRRAPITPRRRSSAKRATAGSAPRRGAVLMDFRRSPDCK